MSGWQCPNCKTEHQDGDYPDHWSQGGHFDFDCDCGATFRVDVDWSPYFHVRKSTLKMREKDATP